MMDRKVLYSISASSFILIAMGIVAIQLQPGIAGDENNMRIVASLTVFYSVLNAISFSLHNTLRKQGGRFLTQFFLIDKIVRFILSIFLIGILLYSDKTLGTAVLAFAYYIVAMTTEVAYFVMSDKKINTKNA